MPQNKLPPNPPTTKPTIAQLTTAKPWNRLPLNLIHQPAQTNQKSTELEDAKLEATKPEAAKLKATKPKAAKPEAAEPEATKGLPWLA